MTRPYTQEQFRTVHGTIVERAEAILVDKTKDLETRSKISVLLAKIFELSDTLMSVDVEERLNAKTEQVRAELVTAFESLATLLIAN